MIQQTVFPLRNIKPSRSNALVIALVIILVILVGIIIYKIITSEKDDK